VEFQSLRKNGHAVLLPFDEQDAPALRGRNQWVVTAAGIEILNARWLDISYEEVLPTTAGQSEDIPSAAPPQSPCWKGAPRHTTHVP